MGSFDNDTRGGDAGSTAPAIGELANIGANTQRGSPPPTDRKGGDGRRSKAEASMAAFDIDTEHGPARVGVSCSFWALTLGEDRNRATFSVGRRSWHERGAS